MKLYTFNLDTPCARTFTNSEGTITKTSGNQNCSYLIRAPSSKQIQITFLQLNMDENPSCSNEKVEVHDGSASSSPLMYRVCGSLKPRSRTSLSNRVHIKYSVINEPQSPRIKIGWKFVSAADSDNQAHAGNFYHTQSLLEFMKRIISAKYILLLWP